MKKARALLKETAGAAVIEYSMIIAMISIALVMNLPPLQDGFCDFTTKVVEMLGSTSSCGGGGSGSGNGNGNNGNGNGNGGGNGSNGGGNGNGNGGGG